MAYSRITHSGMLCAQIATCSPGSNRPTSERAARSASSSSSAYVHCRRAPGSATPAVSASPSGAAAAAARSTPPTVVSSTGSVVSASHNDSVSTIPTPLFPAQGLGRRCHRARSPRHHASPVLFPVCPNSVVNERRGVLPGSRSCRSSRSCCSHWRPRQSHHLPEEPPAAAWRANERRAAPRQRYQSWAARSRVASGSSAAMSSSSSPGSRLS